MEFFHGIVALVAGIVLILTGLVAWMYIQQSRMAQAINALAVAVTTPPPSFLSHPPVEEPVEEPVEQQEQEHHQEQVVDDRVSVHDADAEAEAEADHEDEQEQGVIGEDISDFTGKTVAELRQLLTAKGIPYSKSDKKPVLLSLVQAAA
jgi:archaellum component FlaD/FlaE